MTARIPALSDEERESCAKLAKYLDNAIGVATTCAQTDVSASRFAQRRSNSEGASLMPLFKVELHRRMRDSYGSMPEPNPFLGGLPPDGKTVQMLVREWIFEAQDEAEVRRLLQEAYMAALARQGLS